MKKKKKLHRSESQQYSESFKWKVVEEVLNGEITQAEAKRKYGIKSHSAILYWTRQFSGIKNYRTSREVYLPEQDKIVESPKDRKIRELETSLEKEKNRALLYEKMIEVAEEEYGLSIRKKSGAKQLQKLKMLKKLK